MRVKYKGKFREALLDYISDQPWMFELDGCGMQFEELPVAMQFGVVIQFSNGSWLGFSQQSYSDAQMVARVKAFQEWYNRQEQ